ncbi:hypothetical protein A8M77_23260 [Variovorax sp. JS1663]|nr:hypothetical protein A8M77_23260 [Variovorax sp. JS1663]
MQLEDVLAAADALVAQGVKPTIERVRQHLGGGSPNTVSPMLDVWFERLPARLMGRPREPDEAEKVPLVLMQLWEAARREADQVQIQKSEAVRRQLELERAAIAQKEADLLQRERAFEQARVALDEALASSRQAVAAMEAQMHARHQEAARLLGDSEAEVRRLRKALEVTLKSKEDLREKAATDLEAKQRSAADAEERHLAQERRLLSEIDRERMATRQANAELAKEQKARAAESEASRTAMATAQQRLHEEQSARRTDAASWARQLLEAEVQLAARREREAAAEQRVADLASQLQRQAEQSDREITQLRESHAAAAAALRQLETKGIGEEKPQGARARRSLK